MTMRMVGGVRQAAGSNVRVARVRYAAGKAQIHALAYHMEPLDVRIPRIPRISTSWRAKSTTSATESPSSFFDRAHPEFTSSQNVDQLFDELTHMALRNMYAARQDHNERAEGNVYLPPEHVKPKLPPITEYSNVFLSLWLNVANGSQGNAWALFVEHLQNLEVKREREHLDQHLFDGLFWLIASETTESNSMERHAEVFDRITVMLEYANAFGISPTILQVRRMAYVWVTLCLRKEGAFTIPSRLIDSTALLDGPLTSSLIALLTRSNRLLEAFGILRAWNAKDPSESRVLRSESFDHNNDVMTNDRLTEKAWSSLLECCVRLRESNPDDAKEIGWYVVQHGTLPSSFRLIQSYLAAFLPRQKLVDMLPESMRKHLGKKVFRPAAEAHHQPSDAHATTFGRPDEEMRIKLFVPVSTLLARERKDPRVASWMLDRLRNQRRWMMTAELNELFSEGANASASNALSTILKPGSQFVEHVKLSLRFLESCDRKVESSAPGNLIHALQQHVKEHHGFSITVMSLDQWRTLVRRLTTVLVRQDEKLGVWTQEHDLHAFRHLISFHINLKDFPFAKQLFRIYSARQSRSKRSVFNPRDFLWMFQKALEMEERTSKEGLLWSLFMHWYTTVLRTEYLPKLPTSLMRPFIQRNFKRQDEIPFLLQCMDMFAEKGSRHGLLNKNQSERLIYLLCSLPHTMLTDTIPFAQKVLRLAQEQKYTKHLPHIIRLHSRVLLHLRQKLQISSVSQRAECLALFESLRKYAKRTLKPEDLLGRKDEKQIRRPLVSCYLSALRVMRHESMAVQRTVYTTSEQANDWSGRIDELVDELESYWSFDLFFYDHISTTMPITTSRLASYAFAAEWDKANELYTGAMNAYARRQAEREESLESGEEPPPKMRAVPTSVATRLALSMGRAGLYNKAHEVLALYLRCTMSSTLSDTGRTGSEVRLADDDDGEENHVYSNTAAKDVRRDARSLIEVAGVSLLCMQGRTQEALDRIYSLYRLGVFGQSSHDASSTQEHRHGRDVMSTPPPPLFQGPSNAFLSQIFTLALRRDALTVGDWKDEIRTAQTQLQTLTGAEIVTDDPSDDRIRTFLDEDDEEGRSDDQGVGRIPF